MITYQVTELQELFEQGARFILCRQDSKAPARGEVDFYTRPRPTAEQIYNRARAENLLIGIVPASLDLLCIDLDKGNPDLIEELLKNAGVSFVSNRSRREGGRHIWIKVPNGMVIGNSKWRNRHGEGDIRHAKGYIIIWHIDALFEALELHESDPSDTLAILNDMFKKQSGLWTEGERNDTLFKEAAKAKRRGQSLEPLKQKALSAGLEAHEVEATLKSAESIVEKQFEENNTLQVFPAKDAEALRSALSILGYDWRYNNRAGVREVYRRETGWKELDDLWAAALCETIGARFEVVGGKANKPLVWRVHTLLELMDGLVYSRQVDPFLEWLKQRPAWDMKPRLSHLLHDFFGADDDQLSKWASRYLFLACVQRSHNPGSMLQEIPVLKGPQGIGKSLLLRSMFPRSVQGQWFSDSLDLGVDPQKQLESFIGRVLVEIPELTGSRHSIARMKAFITRQDDNGVRGAYKRTTEQRPRNCAFVATTNDHSPLPNDPTGNRRYVVIPLKTSLGRIEDWLLERNGTHSRVDMLWAEAIHLHECGEDATLDYHLREIASDRAEGNRFRDESIEESIEELESEPYLFRDILVALDYEKSTRAVETRIKSALTNAGWSYRSYREGKRVLKRWCPPGFNPKMI